MVFRPQPDALIAGKYRLIRRLASGGMGSVWLAKHVALDAEIAVKLMAAQLAETPTAMSRFEREAKASAQLRSPHIVKVQDYGIEDEVPFMVMEALEGEDLGQRLGRVGRMPLPEVAALTVPIAKALRVAHEAGIVHRDLKPSNVFLAREGGDEIVKLLDFGIARETRTQLRSDAGQKPRELVEERTGSGVVLGSPHHMSPEQAHGEKVDHRSDLWSLGVVLFRALTGQRPFEGEAMTVVMLAVVSKPIPRVTELCPELPKDLDRFFARALSRDVDGRFDSAMDMANALGAIARGESPDAWLRSRGGEVTVLGRGPDDITVEAVATGATPGSLPRAPAVGASGPNSSDATGSREFSAVTTGLGSGQRKRSLLLRLAPLGVLALGIGAVGFYLGRGESVPAAPTAASTPAPSAPPATQTAIVTPVLASASGSAGAASSGVVAVTPASAGLPSAPRTAVRTARTTAPDPATPRPKKIDPFTGLPIP